MTNSHTHRNWFDQGGEAYARYRPQYPAALAEFLVQKVPRTSLAVDVGCGNGQLTTQIANHVNHVIGIDASANQLAHAVTHPRVEYMCASAEKLPAADHSVSLITAAQCAHWFDLELFYTEVRRIGVAEAVVSLISYGPPVLDGDLTPCFDRFYWNDLEAYWPPGREHVQTGYRELPFPFREYAAPPLSVDNNWTVEEFLGYISTWSAVRQLQERSGDEVLDRFGVELTELWGDPGQRRMVRAPIAMRIGTL
ncbi:MAG: class I SAM-dependent methyltransferase [Actinomycetota bacterium]